METTGEIEASHNMVVSVPKGVAYVFMDGKIMYSWDESDETKTAEPYTVADVEMVAKNLPDKDWQIVMGDRVYRRDDGRWKCLN